MKHIKPIGLFRTPADITEVQDWIATMPQSDQAGLSTAAFMTWNLMAGYYNDDTEQLQDVIKMLVNHIEEEQDAAYPVTLIKDLNGKGGELSIEYIKELIK